MARLHHEEHLDWRPSVWNVDYALTINVGFGNMPFSLAKGIDVAWDLVVGRGEYTCGDCLKLDLAWECHGSMFRLK